MNTLKLALTKVKRYRQSVLKAAVQGDLSKAWRESKTGKLEPASTLLARVLLERRERWEVEQKAKGRKNAKYLEPQAPDVSGLPELPESWVSASLGQISDVVDPNPSHRMPNYVGEGIPFISIDNFTEPESINFDVGKRISLEKHLELSSNLTIGEGDFLFSRIGTIGKTRFLTKFDGFSISHSLVLIKRQSDEINPTWLKYVTASNDILNQAKKGVQSVGVPDLGVGKMRRFAIPFCTFEEQTYIAAQVELHLSAADHLERTIKTNLKRAERLRQSTLKKAFSGKLVAQDPTDEPASVLLERIRALREIPGKQKRGQKVKIQTMKPENTTPTPQPTATPGSEEAKREAWQNAVKNIMNNNNEVLKRLSDA